MSETQNINDVKVEGSVNVSATDVKPSAKALIESLRELGTSWAETAIGYGRVALENVAHALERTAEKLGVLQEKLKKGDAIPAVH